MISVEQMNKYTNNCGVWLCITFNLL